MSGTSDTRSRTAPRDRRRACLILVAVGAVLAATGSAGQRSRPADGATPDAAAPPGFVGGARCARCHPAEARAFAASDHARAMQPATEQTVLGRFDGSGVTLGGVRTRFFRRAGRFVVRTDGPDGRIGDFTIAYTFGVRPLQQYLVPLPGGRLQAFGIAWDSRPAADGGQRWLALYPRQRLAPPDPLHWTGREQTWNYQCADCHSTDLRKQYDLEHDRYATTWAEVSISCEACHGPGSEHVAWAARRPAGAARAPAGTTGLVVRLVRPTGAWTDRDAQRGIAVWRGEARSSDEVDACARCHARRRAIVDPYPYGRPFLDTHAPALLQAGLYHADGQIEAEVYEYGSFVQSAMFRAGVTCSDCHEPHALGLRAEGNRLCAGCHLPARFDVPAHHRHRPGTEAARCVACHMPARTYMRVDRRRDHGFRVPRPDLTVGIGTPNACTECHRDRPARWAAERVVAWYGPAAARHPQFATALDAGRRGLPSAEGALAGMAADREQPGIARATALSLLAEYLTPRSLPAVTMGLADPDPLVRAAAVAAVEALPTARRAELAAARLADPIRLVRLAAARALAGAPIPPERQGQLDRALGELVASELVDADRPEAHVNVAAIHARLGRLADAETALRTALRLDAGFVPALVELASLLGAARRDAEAERLLAQALQAAPESADAVHALGLLRFRQGRPAESVALLGRAAALRPDSARFAYLYAVALRSTPAGRDAAIPVLEEAHRRRPADRDVLAALARFEEERGDTRAALRYAEELALLVPDDAEVRRLVESLRRAAGS